MPGLDEGFRGGGAGAGDDEGWAAQGEGGADVAGERGHVVRQGEGEIRQGAVGAAGGEGFLGREHAGGAAAEDHGDAVGAMAGDGAGDGGREAVGVEGHVGEAVVAAIVVGEGGGEPMLLDAVDAADPAGGAVVEIIGAQAALTRLQGGEHRRLAVADCADRGGGGHSEGVRRNRVQGIVQRKRTRSTSQKRRRLQRCCQWRRAGACGRRRAGRTSGASGRCR